MESTSTKVCRNCGLSQGNGNRFCPDCGQEFKSRIIGFRQFLLDFAGDYFTYDSKLVRSIKPLMFSPGFLTQEYLKGRIARYIPPLRMYIFISVIFFLLLATGKSSATYVGEGLDAAFFDAYFDKWMPRLFLVMLPLFAWIMMVVVRQRLTYYLTYFIFSLHFHAFTLLFFSFYLLISRFITLGQYGINQWLITGFVILTEWYLLKGLQKVFSGKIWKSLLQLILINILYLSFLVVVFLGIAVLLYLNL